MLRLLPHEAQVVLDAGCGEGTLTRRPAARVPLAVGLDLDLPSLEAARQQGAGPCYVLGDLLAPPFPEGCFDAVLSV